MKLPFISALSDTKKKLIAALIIVLALGTSYGAGRYGRPSKVVEKDHKEQTTKKDTTGTTKADDTKVTEQQAATKKREHTHTTTTKTISPDGTTKIVVEKDVVKGEDSVKNTKQEEQAHAETKVEQHEESHSEEDHSKLTLNLRESWRVGILAGVAVPDFISNPRVIWGLEVEKRLIGPLYVGAWVLNLGTFTDPKLAAGIKGSVGFQ